MIDRNHAYSEPMSQTLDKALRDALVDYQEIGHVGNTSYLSFTLFII